MPTVIDSLSIEIESSSASAAKGIDELAGSLSKLKKSGSVGVAVKNLNNLATALKSMTSASSNANKITALAGAMEKLKSVGSTGSGVKKMAESLASLKDATKSLDDETIKAFADRVELVVQKLTPLSAKMTTIQAGFKAINAKATKAGAGVNKFGGKLNASAINMSSFIHIMQSVVRWLDRAIDGFKKIISDSIEWDGIAQRFGRGFGDQAQEAYEWIQRLNEEMGINTQQFMQYSSVYATMLKGFGVANKDSAKMALGYMELTYDIWAGYNDQYKSLSDAADAVKSAIAGEVEPVRRAGFTIVEATLKQTAANHGLKISLESATEAQKSYLRYLTMVDQAHAQGIVGTYAKELNTAEGVMRTLNQQLKSLAQSFGSLFLPVLKAVVPYLQAVVDLARDAVYWLANLFGVEIQAIDWSGYNSGVGAAVDGTEALGDAAKEAKRQLMGIDELNVLQDNKGSGSGAGGAGFEGLDVESLWDETIFDSIQSQVSELKEKLKGVLTFVGLIGVGFAAWKFSSALTTGLNTIGQALGVLTRRSVALTPAATALAKTLKFAGVAAAIFLVIQRFKELYESNEEFRTGVDRLKIMVSETWKVASEIIEGAKKALSSLGLDVDGFGSVLLGLAALFLPGGKVVGAIIIGYGLITEGLKALGRVSGEEWLGMMADMRTWWDITKASAKDVWESLVGWFRNIGQEFKRIVDQLKKDWKMSVDQLKKDANTYFSFSYWKQKGIDLVNGLLSGLSNLKTKVQTKLKEAFSLSSISLSVKTSYSNDNSAWKQYASGGFPTTGEMFVAREAGPELVGRMGNRTAVANNFQIVEGVASGVESANESLITAFYAMGQQIVQAINSKETNTYIDTRKITTAQNQRSRAYGV